MSFSNIRKLQVVVAFALPLAIAQADFIETFSNGSDDGNWHLTENPDRLLQIEANGGNPGAYLHGQVFTPVPTWYVPVATSSTHFLGNYYAQHVGQISFDLDIFSGTQAPNRAVTLDLRTTPGTGRSQPGVGGIQDWSKHLSASDRLETVLFPVRRCFDLYSTWLGVAAR